MRLIMPLVSNVHMNEGRWSINSLIAPVFQLSWQCFAVFFTKYGTIDGEVLNLSKDAVPLEDVGYVYAARVSMAKSDMHVGNKLVNLTPGMNVSMEVKTGKRRMIEFFMSPLLHGINETARERQ